MNAGKRITRLHDSHDYDRIELQVDSEVHRFVRQRNATYVPHRNLEFRILGMTTGVINPTLDTLRSRDERG